MRSYSKYVIAFFIFSFNSLNAKNLQANFQYFTFQNADGTPYIETYLSFLSTTINYTQTQSNLFQGAINVEISIKKEGEIYHYDKYNFSTPIVSDTLLSKMYIDKQMYALPNGSYTMDLRIQDYADDQNVLSTSVPLDINFSSSEISFSDIMFVGSYTKSTTDNILSKSGYDIIPLYCYDDCFLDESINQLNFYFEWYNTDVDTSTRNGYLLNYFIENEQTHIPLTDYNRVKRKTIEDSKAVLGGFEISNLPSGNYNLVFTLLNKNGKAIKYKRLFFQRKNTKALLNPEDYASLLNENSFAHQFDNIEELAENISSLLPIATQREWSYASNQLKKWNLNEMKQFFQGFWENRNPLHPEEEWLKYYKGVLRANEMFSTIKVKGFATDRGRIFLKHGTADYIENSVHENYTLPYQIWTYNKIENQSNRIFIFAETALGTNDYELIHSTARGEINNQNWKNWIYRERGAVKDLDYNDDNRDLILDKSLQDDENKISVE